jgi:hypothetical protein
MIGVSVDDRQIESCRFWIMSPTCSASSPSPQFSVRWEPEHSQVLQGVAARLGMKRQHMAASILATALGLPRPENVPAVPVDLDSIAELAADVQRELQSQEVLTDTA